MGSSHDVCWGGVVIWEVVMMCYWGKMTQSGWGLGQEQRQARDGMCEKLVFH